MARKEPWYDLHSAKLLFDFVADNFTLRTTDKKAFRALQSLESQQDGFCKDIVANHRIIARAAKISLKTVGVVLGRLKTAGLIEYKPGSRTYADHKASRVRRKTIRELEQMKREQQPAYKLAEILRTRFITYGTETVKPKYRIATTNRIYTRQPNVQGRKKYRSHLLASGCKQGEVLLELDFSAAEPSVIAQTLGYSKDGYEIIAEAEGIDRETVKGFFSEVVYTQCRSTITTAKRHGISTLKVIEFLAAVDGLREELRRPNGKPVRCTTTKTSTKVETPLRKKVHNGTLLSYYAQGTIADFINRAALKIIDLERNRGWRLVITCHDSVYVIARPEHEKELRAIIMAEVAKTDLKMKVKVGRRERSVTQGSSKKAVHSSKLA